MTAKRQHWWREPQQVRKTAFVAVVVAGGLVQYARSETRHPSLLLRVWGWIYAVLLLLALVAVLVSARSAVRDRLQASKKEPS
jgi:ABC-type multidrug transport system permease subunit